jgi:hypothetical protein
LMYKKDISYSTWAYIGEKSSWIEWDVWKKWLFNTKMVGCPLKKEDGMAIKFLISIWGFLVGHLCFVFIVCFAAWMRSVIERLQIIMKEEA